MDRTEIFDKLNQCREGRYNLSGQDCTMIEMYIDELEAKEIEALIKFCDWLDIMHDFADWRATNYKDAVHTSTLVYKYHEFIKR